MDAVDQGKKMMVPISSDGMTTIELKDLPGYLKSHPEVKRSHWFGFVDTKDCKDCGQGCEKHGEEKPFANEHSCRVMDPAKCKEEQYPEAEPELIAKIAKQDPNFQVVDEGDDPRKQILEIEVKIAGLQEGISRIEEAIRKAEETIAKYKPLLEALPPHPDGGTGGGAGKRKCRNQ